MSFSITTSEHENWKLVHFQGRVDAFNERAVLEAFKPFQADPAKRVALELGQCESLNIRFLREIVRWAEDLRYAGGELILMNTPVAIKRTVEIFVGQHRIRQVASKADLTMLEVWGESRGKKAHHWEKSLQ